MIEQLPEIPIPEWLATLSASQIENGRFPLDLILQDSLYYPAAGFDGDPVKHLAGNILSFVYVDYGYTRDEFLAKVKLQGFRGYNLVAVRSVTETELVPRGWNPMPPTDGDGDPLRRRDRWKEPFCSWLVFERGEEFAADHGPARFSLLYLCADGAATFQALYVSNKAVPKAIAIIQPGTGSGWNWTEFTDPEAILARSVLGNPSGQPEILLCGGKGGIDFYRKPCWPNYGKHVCFLGNPLGRTIGVWSKDARP